MYFQSEKILNVEFYDLDPMNVVWHGNYVKYIEAARSDLFNKLGYSYIDMHSDGIAFPIATMEMKYIKPCRFNQELKVVSTLEEIEPCLIIKYTIFDDKTGEKLFKAKTMQICVDINTMKSIYEAPEKLKKKLSCCKV